MTPAPAGGGTAVRSPALTDPSDTALLVIDVQNDFCHPDGVAGRAGRNLGMMPAMIKRLQALLAAGRRHGVLPIFVEHLVLDHGASDAPAWTYFISRLVSDHRICLPGTWGQKTVAELAPLPGDLVVTKHRSSAFHGTNLEVLLRAGGIRRLLLTGVLAEGCVESTLRSAFHRDFYVALISDCTASYDPGVHEAYLKVVSARHDVLTADAVMAGWAAAVRQKGAAG